MTVTIHYAGANGEALRDVFTNIPQPGVNINPPGIVLVASPHGDQAQAMYPLTKVVKIELDHGSGIVGATVVPFGPKGVS